MIFFLHFKYVDFAYKTNENAVIKNNKSEIFVKLTIQTRDADDI